MNCDVSLSNFRSLSLSDNEESVPPSRKKVVTCDQFESKKSSWQKDPRDVDTPSTEIIQQVPYSPKRKKIALKDNPDLVNKLLKELQYSISESTSTVRALKRAAPTIEVLSLEAQYAYEELLPIRLRPLDVSIFNGEELPDDPALNNLINSDCLEPPEVSKKVEFLQLFLHFRANPSEIQRLIKRASYDLTSLPQTTLQAIDKLSPHIREFTFEADVSAESVLAVAKAFPNLKKLTFYYAEIESLHIVACLKYTQVSELEFIYSKIANPKHLHFLSEMKALRSLRFSYCEGIEDTTTQHIMHLDGLVALKINIREELTDNGALALCNLKNLEELTLTHSSISDNYALFFLKNLPKLRSLDVSNSHRLTTKTVHLASSINPNCKVQTNVATADANWMSRFCLEPVDPRLAETAKAIAGDCWHDDRETLDKEMTQFSKRAHAASKLVRTLDKHLKKRAKQAFKILGEKL